MIERSRRVVLLIDYDNLQICASRDTPGRDLQLPPVVQLAQHYGTVIQARAYAEWNLSTERLAVYKAGIEPAFAPVLRTESDRSGKSLADTVMVAEGMDMLWTLSPDVVVLATSDKDLIPLVRVAKQRGAFVVVLGSDFTAIPLREMADEHVTYKQLITDAQGRYVTEAGPARQPAALPEPARRRPTRERNGRERTLIAPPAAALPIAATPPPARLEREPQASSTPIQNPLASTAASEPVAPLTVGLSVDGDAQGLGRRRRRRGSRRRSERVGGVGEGMLNADGEPEAEGALAEGSLAENAFTQAPFTGDTFAASVPAEDPFPEDPQAEEPEGLRADLDVPSTQAFGGAGARSPSTDLPFIAPDAAATAALPVAPRSRRRSARRPPAGMTVTSGDAGAGQLGAAEESIPEPSLAATSQTPDILWAADVAQTNGTPAPAGLEADSASSEPAVDETAVAPRPRSRRVTGARGRTRPTPSR